MFVFVLQGCITTGTNISAIDETGFSEERSDINIKAVQFPAVIPLITTEYFKSPDKEDMLQRTYHAIRLYDMREFSKAGESFYDLAIFVKDKVIDDEFVISCLTASALSYFEAREYKNMFSVTEMLKAIIEKKPYLDIPLDDTYIVIAIADKLNGQTPYLPAYSDNSITEIFGVSQ